MTTKTFQKTYFDVLGLCCSSEVPLIEKLIKPLDGVKAVSVIVASRTLIVVHDNLVISQLQIVNTLNQARLEANIRVYGEANYINKWPSPYAIACGVFLLCSFLKYVYHPLQWLALVAVAIGILPIVLKGYAALRNFTLDTNILVIIAVVGSIALKDYWEAGSIVFLFTIAQWLESRASHKATAVMSSLMNMVPQKAILAETGEEIDASEVKLNTILAVKAGENVPIDGIVVDGNCEVDEKTLTGESFPVSKQTDSIVWAGTVNLNGYISVKTTALAEDCVVAKMAKLVEEAQNNKSKTQRFIDKCAKFYTPAIVGISICLAAIPAILKVHNQRHWFHLALVVLVSGCPCALILSTPVATFCALSKAATSGVLIKGGEYLETLSKIKIMGFDKTGTITKGEFVVTEFQGLVEGVSLNTLLYWISSIESKSSHPMAAALIDYGRSLSIEPKPENVEQFENYPGEGVYGKIDEKNIYIGNRKIASRAGCESVFNVVPGPRLGGEGKSIGYIFMGGACVGVFSLSDTCRSGVKEAINELKSMGIKTAMLTGDNNEAASIAQNQLEGALEVVRAELLPQDKANIIKEFQKQAPTAMVGDGLNDAPALATADIGISMGVSGSALANETSHVILMSNDIRKIPEVVKLARKAHMKVVQNVSISILTKAAILGLAFGGYPYVWAAVLADVGTCLVVILNSMLLLKGNEGNAKECHKSSWKDCFRKKGCNSHHQTSHSHEHSHNHSHKHDHVFISSGTHNHDCSKPCNGHVKNSNLGQTKGCCAHKHQVKEVEHSHEYDMGYSGEHKDCSSNQKLVEKHEHRVEIGKEGPFDNISCNSHCHSKHCNEKLKEHHGVDDEVADSKRSGLSGEHEHRCTKPCDGHVKNRIEKVEHTHDHNTGFNCEHKHEENAHFLAGKHKHCAKIVEKGHLEHTTSNGHCHSTFDIQNYEENHDLNNEGAIFCKSDHRCINHKTEECGATSKVCSSNLEKRYPIVCSRNIREKCCGKNMGFGGKVERLSEVVVE